MLKNARNDLLERSVTSSPSEADWLRIDNSAGLCKTSQSIWHTQTNKWWWSWWSPCKSHHNNKIIIMIFYHIHFANAKKFPTERFGRGNWSLGCQSRTCWGKNWFRHHHDNHFHHRHNHNHHHIKGEGCEAAGAVAESYGRWGWGGQGGQG